MRRNKRGGELQGHPAEATRENNSIFFSKEAKVMWECEKKQEGRELGEVRYEEGQ